MDPAHPSAHQPTHQPTHRPATVTALLARWSDGETVAADRLLPLVYADLKRIAAGCARRERAGHTLQPTALVHEACLRLLERPPGPFRDRRHFFATAARLMRHLLIDHARRRRAARRGGGAEPLPLTPELVARLPAAGAALAGGDPLLRELDRALDELARWDRPAAEVVGLRIFAGLTVPETAAGLGISPRTVDRHWRRARAWLQLALAGEDDRGGSDRWIAS